MNTTYEAGDKVIYKGKKCTIVDKILNMWQIRLPDGQLKTVKTSSISLP